MADVTVIGRGSKVRGRITGDGSLEINGHVEGEVDVTGDVTVGDGGLIGSNLSGRRLVVRGAIKGDLVATEAIALESGARVVGDLRAPRVGIASGALVRGHVQTEGAAGGARSGASRARASSARTESAPRAVAAPPPPKSSRDLARAAAPKAAPKPVAAARKGPPAPVVPVLKKGAKGALKKRAGG
jgi:cytoskeletal protein CcmA (bactofilin family)